MIGGACDGDFPPANTHDAFNDADGYAFLVEDRTLLHVQFEDRLPPATMRSVMQGYRGRYAALKDAVTEVVPNFRDDLLGAVDVIDLMTEPVYVLAEHWAP